MTASRQPGKKKQNGIVLLVLVIALALVISVYYFSSISVVDVRVDNIKTTRAVLKQAKQALISYAITHVDGNGGGVAGEYAYLPCPDSSAASTEGNQDPTCGGTYKNQLGYLPWKSLDLPALKDGSGSCLWYAVSGNYKGENSSGLINDDTNGQFQVVDASGVKQDQIVALILAPGAVLSGQSRNIDVNTHCGEDYGNPAAYLEGNGAIDNANVPDIVDSVDQFIQATVTSDSAAVPYNDYLVTITREEIWQAILLRSDINTRLSEVTEALALCLANYVNNNANKRFPWPAVSDLGGGDYRNMNDYSDELNAITGYAGRFPFNVDDSNTELGLAGNVMMDMGFCNPVTLTSGVNVDLQTAGSEYRIILNNWKDHFFYAVSKDFSLPDNAWAGCSGDCVSVGGTDYAAIVFYSGSPYREAPELQSRNNADKFDISNYLENGNDGLFPDAGGNGAYTAVDPDPLISNDIMFCLTDNAIPTVVNCL